MHLTHDSIPASAFTTRDVAETRSRSVLRHELNTQRSSLSLLTDPGSASSPLPPVLSERKILSASLFFSIKREELPMYGGVGLSSISSPSPLIPTLSPESKQSFYFFRLNGPLYTPPVFILPFSRYNLERGFSVRFLTLRYP